MNKLGKILEICKFNPKKSEFNCACAAAHAAGGALIPALHATSVDLLMDSLSGALHKVTFTFWIKF